MKNKRNNEQLNIQDFPEKLRVKDIEKTQIPDLCDLLRAEILKQTSIHGGHLSSNLGTVELTVALHRVFDFPNDKLIFDVGHQSYTHKILTGRSLESLNEIGGISGFQKRSESIYDCYDAGHSSTALSAASAFAYARRKNKDNFEIIAVVGDASIINGLSFEALNYIGGQGEKIIIILNDNGMSISPSVGGAGKFFRNISSAKAYVSFKKGFRKMLREGRVTKAFFSFSRSLKNALKRRLIPLNMFDNLGLCYLGPYDGHNEKGLEKALLKARRIEGPVILHVKTIKGKGYEPAEKDDAGTWHGVGPFDLKTGEFLRDKEKTISWSSVYARLLERRMAENEKLVLVSPGTFIGSDFNSAFARFPDRCIDIGISEEHGATFSGALSLTGFHPVYSIYSTFLQRAYDEISHDCARMGANVTFLIDRAGLIDKYGETHQGIYDEGFLRSIPGVTVAMASKPSEAAFLFDRSVQMGGVVGIRVPKETIPVSEDQNDDSNLPSDGLLTLVDDSKNALAVVSIGPMARKIQRLLSEKRLPVSLYCPLIYLPVPTALIEKLMRFDRVIIHDAYSTRTGFVDALLSALLESGYRGEVIVRSVPNAFIGSPSVEEVLGKNKLTPEDIVEDINASLFEGRN